jgi:hypothetical protein
MGSASCRAHQVKIRKQDDLGSSSVGAKGERELAKETPLITSILYLLMPTHLRSHRPDEGAKAKRGTTIWFGSNTLWAGCIRRPGNPHRSTGGVGKLSPRIATRARELVARNQDVTSSLLQS